MISAHEWKQRREELLEFNSFAPTEELTRQRDALEFQMTDEGFWDDPQKAGKIQKSIAGLQKQIAEWKGFKDLIEQLDIAYELQEEHAIELLHHRIIKLESKLQIQQFLSGTFDLQGAFVSVHSGAGGLDAEDFAGMLVSMYQGFAKDQEMSCNVISLSSGTEAGVKSATLHITGDFVYGLLKEEAGVHRLIRLSPFNSGNTRETSFALVEVLPDSVHDHVEVGEIPEEELRWEYSTSSGKGGQSVNTTYSAVRLYHEPTGLMVSCQNERSQVQNKQQALAILKNRIAAHRAKEQEELKQELKGDMISAEWGSQMRSYTLHPYKLVKDHRSGWDSQYVERFLDGDILPAIWSVKKSETS